MVLQPNSLTLIRHGESEGNLWASKNPKRPFLDETGQLKPTHEHVLTPLGVKQALCTEEYIRDKGATFNVHMTSQYKRAQETFGLIFPKVSEPEVRSDLNEHQRGYVSLGYEHHLEADARKVNGKEHHRPLGGESKADLDQRIRSFLMWLSLYHDHESVVVVGHGAWILRCYMILEQAERPSWDIPNSSVMTFERTGWNKRLRMQSFVTPWEGML